MEAQKTKWNWDRIVATLLIAFVVFIVWENRPPVFYINRTFDQKTKQPTYQVCAQAHRWGTSSFCGFGQGEYRGAEYALWSIQRNYDAQPFWQRWRFQIGSQ